MSTFDTDQAPVAAQPVTPAPTPPQPTLDVNAPLPSAAAPSPTAGLGAPAPAPAPALDQNAISGKPRSTPMAHRVISAISAALSGGAKTVGRQMGGATTEPQWDEQTGERLPDRKISTGERVLHTIGKEMVGISAGLGEARGPGGVGRATAAAANAVLNLNEKQKAWNMETTQSHMQQLAAYRLMSGQDRKQQEENQTHDAPLVQKALQSGEWISIGDPDQPLTGRELAAKFEQLTKPIAQGGQGYNQSQLHVYAGAPIPHNPNKPNMGSEQGHILLIPSASPEATRGISQAPVYLNEKDQEVADRIGIPGVRPALNNQPLPYGMLNSASSDYIVQNSLGWDAQHKLEAAGITGTTPFKLSSITDPAEYQRGKVALNDWLKFNTTGDPKADLDRMRAVNPTGADFINQRLFAGKADDISTKLKMDAIRQESIARDPDKATPSPAQKASWQDEIAGMKYLAKNDMDGSYREEVAAEGTTTGAIAAVTRAANMNAQLMGKEQMEKDRALQRALSDNPLDPATLAKVADAAYQGRLDMSPSYLRSKQGAQVLAEVLSQHEDYDQGKAPAYFKTRQEFTHGKTATSINSYNTAINHLATMFGHTAGADIAQINNPVSQVHRQLEVDKQYLSTELTKAVTNGNMTEKERDSILGSISGNTIASYQDRIRETVNLLKGKMDAWQNQWQTAKPSAAIPDFPFLSPEAKTNLLRIQTGKMNIPNRATKIAPLNGVPHYTNDEGTEDLGLVK